MLSREQKHNIELSDVSFNTSTGLETTTESSATNRAKLPNWAALAAVSSMLSFGTLPGCNQSYNNKDQRSDSSAPYVIGLNEKPKETSSTPSVRPSPVTDKKITLGDGKGVLPPLSLLYADHTSPNFGGGIARDPGERNMVLAPLMLLERDNGGKLKAQVSDDGRIVIPIITYDPSGVIDQACYFKLFGEQSSSAQLTKGRLLSIQPEVVDFESEYGTNTRLIKFDRWKSDSLDSPSGRLNLIGHCSDFQSAKKFLSDLENGLVNIKSSAVFPGAYFKESAITLSFEDIASTAAYQQLSGTSNGMISRHQVSKLAAEALQRAHITIVHDEDRVVNEDFHKMVDLLMGQLPRSQQLALSSKQTLADQLEKYGLDPKDLAADIITSYKLKTGNQGKDFQHLEDELYKKMSIKDGGGSINILDIAEASKGETTFDKESFKKALKETLHEWNITFDEDKTGTMIIPKSIAMSRFDTSSWQQLGSFSFGDRTRIQGEGVYTQTIGQQQIVNNFDDTCSAIARTNETYLTSLQAWETGGDYKAQMDEYNRKIEERKSFLATMERTAQLTGVGRNCGSEKSGSFGPISRDERIVGFVTYYGDRPDNIALLIRNLKTGEEYETGKLMPGNNGGGKKVHRVVGDSVVNGIKCYYEGDDFDGWTFHTTHGDLDARLGGGMNNKTFSLPPLPPGFEWELYFVRVAGGCIDHGDFGFRVRAITTIPPEPVKPADPVRPVFR